MPPNEATAVKRYALRYCTTSDHTVFRSNFAMLQSASVESQESASEFYFVFK